MSIARQHFLQYLEHTLIPDLLESGRDGTADDFRRAIKYIRQLERQLLAAKQKAEG